MRRWTLLAVTAGAAAAATAPLCCPGPGGMGSDRRCADGSALHLDNCSHVYLLEPGRDGTEAAWLDGRGHLLFQTAGMLTDEPPGKFCVSELWPNGSVAASVVCFPDWLETPGPPPGLYQVYGGLLLLSAAFLVATLVVYLALPPLRDREGLCLAAYMGSLTLGSGSLAILQFISGGLSLSACVAMAFFTYYWLLSAFFWLNIVAFNMWQCVRSRRAPLSPRQLALCLSLYGWGCPLVFLSAALATHHAPPHLELLAPGFGEVRCWFSTQQQSWAYFFGPVAVLLATNFVLFVWTAVLLWKARPTSTSLSPHKTLRYRCQLYTKLSLIMGVTWLFEVISFATGDFGYAWLVADVVNCLQGVLVFLLLVVFRRRVRRLLLASCPPAARLFGMQSSPLSQAELPSEDEENCEVAEADADTEDAYELKGTEAHPNGHRP